MTAVLLVELIATASEAASVESSERIAFAIVAGHIVIVAAAAVAINEIAVVVAVASSIVAGLMNLKLTLTFAEAVQG